MKKLLFILSFASLTIITNAQWQQTSLDSVQVNCFAIKGNNIYAGTYGAGIVLSNNNGANWSTCSAFASQDVSALAISDSNIYAAINGFYGGGVVSSSNNGNSWTEVTTGLYPSSFFNAVAIKGINIYVAISDEIFLSSNNGGSWTAIDTYLTGGHIKSLAISDSSIFVGTSGNGMFLSSNNGGTWDTINNGFPTGNSTIITSIAVSNGNIYVGTWGSGAFKSSNNGSNWLAYPGLINDTILSLAIKGDTIFAGSKDGVYFSSDNGSSWTLLSYGLPANTEVLALAISDSNVFAGTANNGIWKMALSNVGINERNNNESNIMVYPNPAINYITIKSLQKSTIEILNIQGQTILQQSLQQGKTNIDISELAKGVYILRLCSNDKTEVTKIVKE